MGRLLLQTISPSPDSGICLDCDMNMLDYSHNDDHSNHEPDIQSFLKTSQVLAIVVPLVTLAVFAVGFYLCYKRFGRFIERLQPPVAPAETPIHPVQVSEVNAPTMEKFLLEAKRPVRFNSQQLYAFTNNYSTKLGSGGSGEVYKGEFSDGEKMAVKVLNRASYGNAERQFMAEVGTIGRTYHLNVVRLYGFCFDFYLSALVYEYMENGSLDKLLFSENESIEWEKLYDIAIGTARGIAYLHEECDERIIHYDIKPGNILLDSKFSAKVADFGLAKPISRDNTHDSNTAYRGTPGYAAPEFLLKHHSITYKCDVYSFGMVLFDIVGRRRNIIPESSDGTNRFPHHVWNEYEKGKLGEMLFAYGIDEKDREKAERMAMVALWCVQDVPEARPPMSAVVKMLEGGVEIVPPPKPFHYLYSLALDAVKEGSNGKESETAEETNSIWYKKTTPVAKYEIQTASS